MKRTKEDAAATRRSAVLMALVNRCGQFLTPDVVNQLQAEILETVEAGPMSWAFRFNESEAERLAS